MNIPQCEKLQNLPYFWNSIYVFSNSKWGDILVENKPLISEEYHRPITSVKNGGYLFNIIS